jgi:hypothetical protein
MHHYVPSFYLAGFTASGDESGDVYVLDQGRAEEWKSSPRKTARKRDFYAVDLGPHQDPSLMEQILGRLEGEFCSIVRDIIEHKRLPSDGDFDCFLNFVALMAVRIPRTRELTSAAIDRELKQRLRETLATPGGWKQFKHAVESKGTQIRDDEYEEYRRFAMGDDYHVNFDQTSHVQMMVKMIDSLLLALAARSWTLGVTSSDTPDLICSDVPVWLSATKSADLSRPVTLDCPDTLLTFPITRRLIALAHFERRPPVVGVNPRGVAAFNTMTATEATQLFAAGPDFTYLDHNGTIRSKADLLGFPRNRQEPYNII